MSNNNNETKKERHQLLGENRHKEKQKEKVLIPELVESEDFFTKHNLEERVSAVHQRKRQNWEIEQEDRQLFFLQNGLSPQSQQKYESMQFGPPTKITDWLYLGGDFDVTEDNMKQMKVGFILNCAEECQQRVPETVCKYKPLTIADIHPTYQKETFEEAFDFIEKARKANSICFLHCARGRSRSVAVAIAYLMAIKQTSLRDAYLLIKDQRKRIGPHYMLKKQLILYEQYLFGKFSLTYDEWNLLELEFFEKYGVSY